MFDTHKTRIIGLLCGKETTTTSYAVAIEYIFSHFAIYLSKFIKVIGNLTKF